MTDVVRAVVTGAASGLGLATVAELVARGARVVGIDLAGDARAAAVEAMGARFLPCDVTSQDAWDRAVSDIESSLGGIDLLALNAGVMTRSPSEAIDDDVLTRAGSAGYRRVFAVNVDGVVFGLAALRPLLAPGAGVVHVQAAFPVRLTKRVPETTCATRTRSCAAEGPKFETGME